MPGPLTWNPPEPPKKHWWALLGGPALVMGVLLWLVASLQLPYVQLAPGGADPINELLEVPPEHAHPPKGSFLLTTVSLRARVGPLDLIRDYFDDDIVVISREAIFGKASDRQYNRAAAQEMDNSKQAAVVVAFRALGFKVLEHGSGALVAALPDGEVPARGQLEPGDVITAIDRLPTMLAQEAIAILQKHRPGDTIVTTVKKADGGVVERTIRVGTKPDATSCSVAVVVTGDACLGVSLATKDQAFDFPFKVTIDTTGVGGPSAGLAFALALIDELTEGELTGGKNVAVTGTIDIDGSVGDVGGVVQKTAAVRRAGASLFLVPPGEFADAQRHAGKRLKVVQVTTLTDALDALRANGGDPAALRPN
ncbi:MAG TPA: S16 family serine protease [Acidimicrobiales bacterium]|nr:S16 family serine protease [Acidimicrobiales bacterium]